MSFFWEVAPHNGVLDSLCGVVWMKKPNNAIMCAVSYSSLLLEFMLNKQLHPNYNYTYLTTEYRID